MCRSTPYSGSTTAHGGVQKYSTSKLSGQGSGGVTAEQITLPLLWQYSGLLWQYSGFTLVTSLEILR